MRLDLLERLRCPHCGSPLDVVEHDALVRTPSGIEAGVLGCECCAFPVVAGIPVLIADDRARDAIRLLEAGESDAALMRLLDLDGDRADAFRGFLAAGPGATYREGLALLSQDAESLYFVYRFSDPTFLVAEALLRSLGAGLPHGSWTLDVCGGSGHLTRVLAGAVPGTRAVVADLYFWKLWLARRFTAPSADAVCCDASSPLPFARGAFGMVVCSDAFPYVWNRRLLAEEMMRAAGADGLVVMPHLHSALGENYTAGMTLTPATYRDLFAPHGARLFRDSAMLDQLLDQHAVDLTRDVVPEALEGEAALDLVASRDASVFRRYALAPVRPAATATVVVNPLYHVERRGETSELTLRFPTEEYADEFRAVLRYLPERLTVHGDLTGGALDPARVGPAWDELLARRVLLDVPPGYC
ncbi:MAG: methyltransferase domain-containing protein [Vicinamibacterales bacterium]